MILTNLYLETERIDEIYLLKPLITPQTIIIIVFCIVLVDNGESGDPLDTPKSSLAQAWPRRALGGSGAAFASVYRSSGKAPGWCTGPTRIENITGGAPMYSSTRIFINPYFPC